MYFLEEVVFNSKQLLSLHNFGNHTFSLNFLYNKIQFQVFLNCGQRELFNILNFIKIFSIYFIKEEELKARFLIRTASSI